MKLNTLLFETEETEHGPIATLTLNRPQVRNAISREMIGELRQVLKEIETRGNLRALIVTGAGDKAFAAGADIAELRERGVDAAMQRINSSLFREIEEQRVPAIAAVNGYALGGGCELAMACDLRIAAEEAKFGQPEVGLGIMAGAGAVQRLPRLVGFGKAKELLFTGRIIDAQEAHSIGLVNRVVPRARLLEEAKATALSIAKQGQLAVEITKLAVNASSRNSPVFDTLDALGQAVTFASEDKYARMTAFLERRKGKKK